MKRADFHYELPPELIAQHPLPRRSASRLLHLDGGDLDVALAELDTAVACEGDRARNYFWRGVVHHLRGEAAPAQFDWGQAGTIALEERASCSRLNDPARLALMRGDVEAARSGYTAALAGPCLLDRLRTEQGYLRRLARCLPDRDDIATVSTWYAESFAAKITAIKATLGP